MTTVFGVLTVSELVKVIIVVSTDIAEESDAVEEMDGMDEGMDEGMAEEDTVEIIEGSTL